MADQANPTQAQPENPPAPTADPLVDAVNRQSQPGGVQPGLEKFKGLDGSLDVSKVGSSYLEAEKALRVSQQETAELRKTMAALAERQPAQGNQTETPTTTAPSSDDLLKAFLADPKGFVANVVSEQGAPVAQELSQQALRMKHPELNDPAFAREVGNWVMSLPFSIRQSEETFEGSDYLVNLYKREKNISAQSRSTNTPAAPNAEPPSATRGGGGRTFTRRQIRDLMSANPDEYRRLETEISKAYQEGRILDN
jgi:hypothetical protein